MRVVQDATGSRTVSWFASSSDTVEITVATPGVVTTTKDIKTGTPVKFSTTGTLPTGLTENTQYYWIRLSATTGNLATTKANALAGTGINTTASGTGVHTMLVQIRWAGDEIPDLTTDKNAIDDFGFLVEPDGTITGCVIAQEM